MSTQKKCGIIFVLTVLFFASALGAYAQHYDKGYYINRARQEIIMARYLEAIADLDTALKLDPNDSVTYNTRGSVYERCGNYSAAMSDYQTAYQLNKGSAEARHNITNLSQRMGIPVDFGDSKSGLQPPLVSITKSSPRITATNSTMQVQYPKTEENLVTNSEFQQIPYEGNFKFGNGDGISANNNNSNANNNSSTNGETGYVPMTESPQLIQGPTPSTTYDINGYRVITYTSANAYETVRAVRANPNPTPIINSNSSGRNVPSQNNQNNQNTQNTNYNNTGNITGNQYSGVRYADNNSAYQARPVSNTNQGQLVRPVNSNTQQNRVVGISVPVIVKAFIDPAAEKYNDVGVTLSNYGKYKEAIAEFSKAIEQYIDYAIAYNNRGVAYALSGDTTSALADFNQALRLNPYFFDAQYNREHVKTLTR